MRTAVFHQSYHDDERLLDSRTQRVWMGSLLATLFTMPFWGSDYLLAMACIVGIHLIATLGLNITTGSAGLISLAHAAFMGVGCYTVAWLARHGWPFWLTLPAAGAVTALLGVVVGLPSLRVKGLYLAIATLAGHFVLSFVFREWDSVTGGVPGTTIPRASLFGFELQGDRRNFRLYWLFVPITILMLAGAPTCSRTRIGRAFIAIRDRDISAEVLGIPLLRYKLAVLRLIGPSTPALRAGCWAYFFRVVTPE
jgi:branched-chain amino acid transport system permease protein